MQSSHFWLTINNITAVFDQHAIPYQFIEDTSLYLQGVGMEPNEVTVEVQWDLIKSVHDLFMAYSPTPIKTTKDKGSFHFKMEGTSVQVQCMYNKAIRTDPFRIQLQREGLYFWCQSFYANRRDSGYKEVIDQHLHDLQMQMTEQNQTAWNQNNYQALINRYGAPEEVAAKIKHHPKGRLGSFYRYMEPVEGKRIAHLMGSNGIKGIALSLLGADVTVVDFSQENAAFAAEVAGAAGVNIQYEVSDVLSFKGDGSYDIILMELGVLHYFVNLGPLFQVIQRLLKPGGQLVLHEFHPISTKLITSKGKKHKVSGNYFDPTIENRQVAFSKYSSDSEEKTEVLQRKWTLGELITAVADTGLVVKVLEEEPNQKVHDIGIPKLFTLVAQKPS
ncbi:class I SAM-dependent methyltransferase [Pseudalkalibacillus salsuginis]|uniref:class I SAM-dependent methyltransferase n=1 Tax=Pseudalkalibacillus salsuginis TaxID=2910972 RepID=UPI001F1FB73F|nr:class I SAM-dependent methyltransferase [Pseudalkalibacillus salsuginis]MCF6410808.1 class I SAM-dependent methyltransferase [Pseudalkalibacillus salsuginis]